MLGADEETEGGDNILPALWGAYLGEIFAVPSVDSDIGSCQCWMKQE